MKLDRPARHLWLSSAVVGFGLFGLIPTAHSECVSPSTESGVAATTVYRCPENQGVVAPKQPLLAPPDKTTVVERGSANVPWFEPKRAESQVEPIAAAVPPSQPSHTVKPIAAAAPPAQPERQTEPTTAAAAPSRPDRQAVPIAAAAPPPQIEILDQKIENRPLAKSKTKQVRKKVVKAKPAKTPLPKVSAKTKTKSKPDSTASESKITSLKPDENTVVWTQEDMPLGSRIVNWLGF